MTVRRLYPIGWLLVVLVAACTAPAGNSAPTTTAAPDQPCDQGGFAGIVESAAPSVVTLQHSEGLGSGVVYKPDIVITNEHVVGNHPDLIVSFADGSESRGTLIAADATTDLAVVRTERKGLTPLPFGKDQPRQGCLVLAIGSPLGLQNSVTQGIVSGLHRTLPADSRGSAAPADLIQTDAPISPGNSGGALLDVRGQVVGINESYIPPQAGAVSLGFAIPAGTATDVAEQLLAGGTVAHAYLGVSVGELTPSIRDRLGAKTSDGALVLAVASVSPAASAGMRAGDVIVRFGDVAIHRADDLTAAVRARKPGDQVTVVVVRGADRLELKVTLGAQP
jgi:S1-C subfamily serine protease